MINDRDAGDERKARDSGPAVRRRKPAPNRRVTMQAAVGADRSPSQPPYNDEIEGRRIVYAALRLHDRALETTLTPDGEFRVVITFEPTPSGHQRTPQGVTSGNLNAYDANVQTPRRASTLTNGA